ncbi:protease inhibitor I42 family protein [Pseudomonas jinjuensis]|uniref:Inhibitor of cysteine peptidase n=1 Tax=Pseudomonas jinjuensis TaxID=198616 RepID=A0A1H0FK92_9PSED|nr:protease inhibitor I42 family protein [Pseudomonas jinjuensis]SDN94859.1 inhibitor of cysteine peptidase [Pseudomonas jinjuensis]
MPPLRLFLPLATLLLGACASQPDPVVTLDDDRDCTPLELHQGQALVLTLPSNPTTGYRWEVRDAAGAVLRSLSPEVYSNRGDSGVVGEDGESTWRFRVAEAGEAHLRLAYHRPWEPDAAPARVFDCAIKVR